jgi:LysR family hydrogen peroxide-inducible transcriptional activator
VPADDPARGRVDVDAVDLHRLILLEEGHCLRDQALAFCSRNDAGQPAGLGATSLTTVMQMVANGLGVTLLPQVAAETEARDERVKILRFAAPEPMRAVGLAWRRTSPRKPDFAALSSVVREAVGLRGARRSGSRAPK